VKSHSEEGNSEQNSSQVSLIKQGWTQVKSLHCKLPEKMVNHSSKNYKRVQIEMIVHYWQHHCLEVLIVIYNIYLKI